MAEELLVTIEDLIKPEEGEAGQDPEENYRRIAAAMIEAFPEFSWTLVDLWLDKHNYLLLRRLS